MISIVGTVKYFQNLPAIHAALYQICVLPNSSCFCFFAEVSCAIKGNRNDDENARNTAGCMMQISNFTVAFHWIARY